MRTEYVATDARHAEVLRQIIWAERQELFPSPERVEWILATYPAEETGRPGIICVSGNKPVRKTDADTPKMETWRTTFEFAGDEEALVEAADQAA
jgi:hypothetical protein